MGRFDSAGAPDCPPATKVYCRSIAQTETAPPGPGASNRAVALVYKSEEAGAETPLADPVSDAFVSRFSSAVAALAIVRGGEENSGTGTGFMISERQMVTAGHVVDPRFDQDEIDLSQVVEYQPDYPNSFATFFYRFGCYRKNVHFARDPVVYFRRTRRRDAAILLVECHPDYGRLDVAFGRLYIRLWHFATEQNAVTLGHVNGDLLRVMQKRVRASVWDCSNLRDPENCVLLGHTERNWEGMSGGPVLDLDGAVRAIYKGRLDDGPDEEQIATRLDAVARDSPDLRKVVRDQSARVQGELPWWYIAGIPEREREALGQQWGRVAATPVPEFAVRRRLGVDQASVFPATDGSTAWPEGWSIFYVDAEFGHVLHLRTDQDAGELIPNVIHEDVSTINGLCALGKPGILHAWYSLPPGDADGERYPARHCLVATTGDSSRSTIWHVVRNENGLWAKHRVGDFADLRWPSAAATAYDCSVPGWSRHFDAGKSAIAAS